jgi:uncharacterized protein (DUF427 family)
MPSKQAGRKIHGVLLGLRLGAARAPQNRKKDGLMKAIWRGQVIAESDRTLEVGGYRYFPRETVRMDLLRVAPKTQSDLACPHGVQFYDVIDGAAQSRRAAWSYEAPRTGMQQVDHWISFWEDIQIK